MFLVVDLFAVLIQLLVQIFLFAFREVSAVRFHVGALFPLDVFQVFARFLRFVFRHRAVFHAFMNALLLILFTLIYLRAARVPLSEWLGGLGREIDFSIFR